MTTTAQRAVTADFEARNRAAKAGALIGQLHAEAAATGALDPTLLVPTTPEGWAALADRAHTALPGERTQAIVRDSITNGANVDADPFDGI